MSRLTRLLTLLLTIVTSFGLIAGAALAMTEAEILEEIRRAQQQQEAERRRIEELQREKGAKQAELDRYTRELAAAEQELYHYTNEISGLESRMLALQVQVDTARADLAAMEAQLAERTEGTNMRLRVLTEMGTFSYLEVLLSASSFTDFISRFSYLSSMFTRDIELMREAKDLRDAVATRQAELDAQRQEMAAIRLEMQQKRATVAALADEVAGYKAEAQSDLDLLLEMEQELNRKADQWDAKIAELQRLLNRDRRDGFAMIWPVTGTITSYFGPRPDPFTGVWRNHSGMDIAVPTGTPIKAAEEGVVIHSGWIDGYGYTIIIDHGGGIATLYAHASKLVAQGGQHVNRGDTVALVGSTGYSTGPHLHFEVRLNGTRVEPLDYLP